MVLDNILSIFDFAKILLKAGLKSIPGGVNVEEYVWETAEELDQKLASRVRNIRKRRNISQQKLAEMSGVSYGSVKRFEKTGQISLVSLTRIAMALNMADELRELFTKVPYLSIEEVIREQR